jgi:serine/threonine protein kinase
MRNHWVISPSSLQVSDTLLGKGKFGCVYLGDWLGTPVAVKHLEEDIKEEVKELVEKEFSTMTRIHHPNVCQLLGFTKEPFRIVMEYFENGNLQDYLENKELKPLDRINIVIDILRGLTYLHSRHPEQVVHRDIKPENLLVSKSGRIKIADFGLSKILRDKNPIQDFRVGTEKYMSPEMKFCQPYSEKTDIWSLGIVLRDFFLKKCKEVRESINLMLQTNPQKRPSAQNLMEFFMTVKEKIIKEESKTLCC